MTKKRYLAAAKFSDDTLHLVTLEAPYYFKAFYISASEIPSLHSLPDADTIKPLTLDFTVPLNAAAPMLTAALKDTNVIYHPSNLTEQDVATILPNNAEHNITFEASTIDLPEALPSDFGEGRAGDIAHYLLQNHINKDLT